MNKRKKRTEHRTDDLRKKKIGQMQIEDIVWGLLGLRFIGALLRNFRF